MPFCNKCGNQIDKAARFCHECGAPAPSAGGDSGNSGSSAGNSTDAHPSGYKTELKPSILYGRVDLENLPKGHLISDRYTIKEKIGRGGFGAVYRVHDSKFAIDKALKVLPDAVAHDRTSMEILRFEARTMGRLNHPNIVRVYDFEETGPVKYLDMEYVSGGNLVDFLLAAPEKKLPEKTVRELGAKIAKGLAYAHQNNVIHRDIKPDNILVSGQNQVKITQVKIMDFGISETLRTSMTRLTSVSTSGTLVYMSPEQLRGKHVGRESDVYSFGAMLYELLSGHPPFYQGAVEHQIINEIPAPIPGVSDDMNRFLQICLAKDFSDRFSDFEKIEKILSGKMPVPESAARESKKGAEELPVSPSGSGSRRRGKKIALVAFLGVIISVLAGAGYFYWNSPASDPGADSIATAPLPAVRPDPTPAPQTAPAPKPAPAPPQTFGSLYVKTEPPAAEVWVDGKSIGQTPVQVRKIKTGDYSLTAKKKYYEDAGREISIKKDIVTRLDLTLKKGKGNITIYSSPPEADVFLDGKKQAGRTPLTLSNVSAGPHSIRLERPYHEGERSVDVLPGKTARIDADLAGFGRLYVDVTPSNAKIQILDIIERFQQGMALTPGTYKIRAEAEGYKTAETRVTVAAGATERASLTLKKIDYKGESVFNEFGMKFVWIKPGTFTMGSPSSESGRDDDERQHRVTLTQGFHMQTTEVTQGQWKAIMGSNPSHFSSCGSDCPVEKVSWNDVQEFIRKLNQQANGARYRLPTEAEWEYACRAGSDTAYCFGNNSGDLGGYAWYYSNSEKKTHPVARKQPNAWGLYDMHGNVWEWCQDWYDKSYYDKSPSTDPEGPSSRAFRVLRGGCWNSDAGSCRSAVRSRFNPDDRDGDGGFRLVCLPGQQSR